MPRLTELTETPAYAPGDALYAVAGGASRKLLTMRVTTVAAMTAIAAPTDGMSVEVTEAHRGGLFVFDTSEVTAANNGTIFDANDSTVGSWVRRYSGPLNVRWFGAVGDGVTDDTNAIQAAVNAAYASTASTLGGATVYIPPGAYAVTSVSRSFTAARTVKIQGAGRLATVIQKIGATTTPVFDFSSGVANTPIQGCDFADLTVNGNAKAHPGIRLTLMNNFTLSRVSIFACSTALDLIGSLIFSAHDCVLTSNNVGLMTRAHIGGGDIYCNSWAFNGGSINSNTTWGVDIGAADGVYFRGTNFERNGTVANTSTGAVIIRNTVDDESIYSVIDLNEVWFEWNEGRMIEVEAATGLGLNISNCHVYGNTGSSTINVGAIRQLSLIYTPMLRAADTVISAATRTLIVGQDPFNYTDNSNTTRISTVVGTLALQLKSGISEPGTNATHGQLYVDSADTALKFKSAAGAARPVALAGSELVTTTKSVTAAENGKTFYLNAAGGFTVTLPAPALGLRYTFAVYAAPTTSYLITTNGGANIMSGRYLDVVGEMVSFSAQDTISFVGGSALYTDRIEVSCDGVGWHCQGYSRADGGIAVSVT